MLVLKTIPPKEWDHKEIFQGNKTWYIIPKWLCQWYASEGRDGSSTTSCGVALEDLLPWFSSLVDGANSQDLEQALVQAGPTSHVDFVSKQVGVPGDSWVYCGGLPSLYAWMQWNQPYIDLGLAWQNFWCTLLGVHHLWEHFSFSQRQKWPLWRSDARLPGILGEESVNGQILENGGQCCCFFYA